MATTTPTHLSCSARGCFHYATTGAPDFQHLQDQPSGWSAVPELAHLTLPGNPLESSGRGGERVAFTDISAILCADWAKHPRRRAVYVADVRRRTVRRLAPDGPNNGAPSWSLSAVLKKAARLADHGAVLATFDAPLGVPASYLEAAAQAPSLGRPTTFLELVQRTHATSSFFEGTADAAEWRVERPFFAVPAEEGGLDSYRRAAHSHGVDLYRAIDRATGAKTLFAKSGIPGAVGSAACALWQELGRLLTKPRFFKVWPFEGDLRALLALTPIVVAEMYPRAAYATALLDLPIASRYRLTVPKTDSDIRTAAIAALQATKWVDLHKVTIEDLDPTRSSEDDFDACLTAAAMLRCSLEGILLGTAVKASSRAEGAMLGTGSVNLELPERLFGGGRRRGNRRHDAVVVQADAVTFLCPIAGCRKVFAKTRGGWDGHVGSSRVHPRWHPELLATPERKRQFKFEFPEFFR